MYGDEQEASDLYQSSFSSMVFGTSVDALESGDFGSGATKGFYRVTKE